ncbi:MAG: type II toxin-antitoxin system RelE/ParE family toxin [Chloroflexi bacterium]|nr:type II toxin-antitoxin system RelE/ParE family toxin [Chloroflexota bacterium]
MAGKAYQLVITRSARKDLLGLPPKIGEQVEETIDRLLSRLREGQRAQDMRRVEGRPDTYRVDTGEYRILFAIDEAEALMTVFRIRHRKDAYRNL